MSSPTKRTKSFLEKRGYLVGSVERWNQFARVRQDLFGFIDMIAISPDGDIVGIQATTGAHSQERITKIVEHKNFVRVVGSKMLVEVWGWRKLSCGWFPKIHRIQLRGKRKTPIVLDVAFEYNAPSAKPKPTGVRNGKEKAANRRKTT